VKYSVRVRGENGAPGSHDTVWDEVAFHDNGWLVCRNYRDPTDEEREANVMDGGSMYFRVCAREHWYPPISIYSVKTLEG